MLYNYVSITQQFCQHNNIIIIISIKNDDV